MITASLELMIKWWIRELKAILEKRATAQRDWALRNPEKKKVNDAASYARHRDSRIASMVEWRENNREKYRAYKKDYAEKNSSQLSQKACKWQKENRERANRNKLAYHRRQVAQNPSYRIEKNIRTRIWYAMQAQECRSQNVMRLLGCSVEEFKSHIERQFQTGWSWENWGKVWEIDHKIPCAKFDLSDRTQQEWCFHLSNQQPLGIFENRSKGAR